MLSLFCYERNGNECQCLVLQCCVRPMQRVVNYRVWRHTVDHYGSQVPSSIITCGCIVLIKVYSTQIQMWSLKGDLWRVLLRVLKIFDFIYHFTCLTFFKLSKFTNIFSSNKFLFIIIIIILHKPLGRNTQKNKKLTWQTKLEILFHFKQISMFFLYKINWVFYITANVVNNPPTTTRVKISQNFDILPKVYLVHLKVKHCQTLHVVRTFTGQNESTVFDW